jgi:hypothetical protein
MSCRFLIKGVLNISDTNTVVEKYSRLYTNVFIINIYIMDLGMLVLSSILDRHFLKSIIRSMKIMCNRSVCFIIPVSVPQNRSSLVAPEVGGRARIWTLVHTFFVFMKLTIFKENTQRP